jgi:hypothetical protein
VETVEFVLPMNIENPDAKERRALASSGDQFAGIFAGRPLLKRRQISWILLEIFINSTLSIFLNIVAAPGLCEIGKSMNRHFCSPEIKKAIRLPLPCLSASHSAHSRATDIFRLSLKSIAYQ